MYTHCFILFLNIYLWLPWVFVAACGFSLVVESRGYSLIAVHGRLIVAVSLVVQHRLSAHRLQWPWHRVSLAVAHQP